MPDLLSLPQLSQLNFIVRSKVRRFLKNKKSQLLILLEIWDF